MSTSVQKAKRTRAKNKKLKETQEKQLRAARSRARNAEAKLKSFKEGFEEALKYMNR